MPGILIMDEDKGHLKQLAEIFIDEGYHVTITDSVASAVCSILKKTAQVVVLGSKCDDLMAADLVPIMRQCNKNLPIILIAADTSLALLRRLRCEGIFYHALGPVDSAGREEIRQAVHCAFANLRLNPV
jgi:DNA-binding NtrC family response regulator